MRINYSIQHTHSKKKNSKVKEKVNGANQKKNKIKGDR